MVCLLGLTPKQQPKVDGLTLTLGPVQQAAHDPIPVGATIDPIPLGATTDPILVGGTMMGELPVGALHAKDPIPVGGI